MNENEKHLFDILSKYPNAKSLVTRALGLKSKDLTWPTWCFLPLSAFQYIISNHEIELNSEKDISKFLGKIKDFPILGALTTWRYSKGIYKFHPETLSELVKSEISGTLPTEILQRLPEWCLYVNLEDSDSTNFNYLDDRIFGFYVHLDYCIKTKNSELRFLLNLRKGLIPFFIKIGDNINLDQSIDNYIHNFIAMKMIHTIDIEKEFNNNNLDAITKKIDYLNKKNDIDSIEKKTLTKQVKALLSLVLYLCSEEMDISSREYPDQKPSLPRAKKTKKGWVYFPAEKAKIWQIGNNIGEKITQSKTEFLGTGKKRAHLRRAHWHGFWTGSEQNKKFIYKWLPPIFVGDKKESQPD